eukprot:4576942-Amphidinium_carterae.1
MGGYDASTLAVPTGAQGGTILLHATTASNATPNSLGMALVAGMAGAADPMTAVGDLSALDGNTAAMMAMQG